MYKIWRYLVNIYLTYMKKGIEFVRVLEHYNTPRMLLISKQQKKL